MGELAAVPASGSETSTLADGGARFGVLDPAADGVASGPGPLSFKLAARVNDPVRRANGAAADATAAAADCGARAEWGAVSGGYVAPRTCRIEPGTGCFVAPPDAGLLPPGLLHIAHVKKKSPL